MARKKKRGTRGSYDKLRDDIVDLVKHLRPVLMQAERLGIFMGDRDLLECPECGLKEDLAEYDVLIVSKPGQMGIDTGLRFKEIKKNSNVFRCPSCKVKAKSIPWV